MPVSAMFKLNYPIACSNKEGHSSYYQRCVLLSASSLVCLNFHLQIWRCTLYAQVTDHVLVTVLTNDK